MYSVSFELEFEDALCRVLKSHLDGFSWDRHELNYEKKDNKLHLFSKSKDMKAMKAGMNSIISMLDIYESVKILK